MTNTHFSEAEIAEMADEVSEQLNALTVDMAAEGNASFKSVEDASGTPLIPARLRESIERETGESAESLWERLRRLFQQDLCLEGGHLHGEWKKYQDLPTKDVVQWTITVLAVLNVAVSSAVVVSISVWLLHVCLNIGIKAICEDCPQS